MEMKLFIYIGVIALLMIANTVFKVAACSVENTFNKALLMAGLKKYALILVGVGCVIGAGSLIPDMQVISMGDTQITILTMLNIVSISLIISYAAKVYQNLISVMELKTEEIKMPEPVEDEEEKG